MPQTHLCALLKWNIKQVWRRPNSLSIRLWQGIKTELFLSAWWESPIGASQMSQSGLFSKCSWRMGKISFGVGARLRKKYAHIRIWKILFATTDLRLDSSLPVMTCLCLLISNGERYSILGNQLHEVSVVLVWQHTNSHTHTHTDTPDCINTLEMTFIYFWVLAPFELYS